MKARARQAMPRGGGTALGAAKLGARLRTQSPQIEEALLTRTYAIADPGEAADPRYAEGLRAAVSEALEYGLVAIERASEASAEPIPVLLLAQARLAARNGIAIDTVLRRYFAGYTVLGDFLIAQAEDLDAASLKRVLRAHAAALERLLGAVAEEYGREATRPSSHEERKAKLIERLLAGEPAEATELSYPLEGHHLALLLQGPGAREALESLASDIDARLLALPREGQALWAWLGSRRELDPEEVIGKLPSELPDALRIATGEPGEGIGAWRLSHRQAEAALGVALRGTQAVVRYAEVALLASVMHDELLVASLRQLYLEPLEAERDGGKVARETLGAYFASAQNVSSTAAALGVARHTVTNRLRGIEERIGRRLSSCTVELSIALRLGSP